MSKGRTIAGALALCALALCGFGTASASATAGLTAVECNEVLSGTGNYPTSACETPTKVESNFETVPFALNAATVVEGTSVGDIVLTGTIALSKIDISCKKATVTGKVTNVTPEGSGKEMQVKGSEGVSHYEECTARLASDTGVNKQACKVKAITGGQGEGKITSAALKATTGPEHTITIEPEVGTTISEFEIRNETAEAGKSCSLPTTKVTVTGKVTSTANTEKHSHGTINGGGTLLKANGSAATLTATTAGHTPAPNTGKVVAAMTIE